MSIAKWIKQLFSIGDEIRNYGLIGSSLLGPTKVIAKIVQVKDIPKLVLQCKYSKASSNYALDINKMTLAKLKYLYTDLENFITEAERIGIEYGILDDNNVPHRCVNCSTKFELNQNSCTYCGKSLQNEKEHIQNEDILGYLKLTRENNPENWDNILIDLRKRFQQSKDV